VKPLFDESELLGTYYQPYGRVGGSTLELAADRRFSVVERRVRVGDQFTTGERWFSVAGTGVPRLPEPPHRPQGFLSGLVRRMRRL
jgi:hypothetical protein